MDKLQKLYDLSLNASDRVAIWMHVNPDPDAIGTALGLSWLLKKKYGVESDIFHDGSISHPENRSLLNVLSLSFKTPAEFEQEQSKFKLVATVDTTHKNTGYKIPLPDIIIDHHRVKVESKKHKFVLIDPQAGAASSLIYELIKASEYDFTEEDTTVSTALLFGILTDTNNLLAETVSEIDFEAFAYFRERANLSWIQEIRSYPIPSYFFQYEAIASAEENKHEWNGTLISFLGSLSPQRRGVLPYIADRLMRKEATDTTIIMAIIDNHLEASVRSKKVSLDVNEFVHTIFGEKHSGGKRGSGGAKVPMGLFQLPEDSSELKDQIIEVTKNMIVSKIKREVIKDG